MSDSAPKRTMSRRRPNRPSTRAPQRAIVCTPSAASGSAEIAQMLANRGGLLYQGPVSQVRSTSNGAPATIT